MKQQPLRYHFTIQKNWRWKIYFSVIQFILIFFWSSAGYSDNFIVTDAGTEYQATSKWSGIFTASNKTVYDTSHLYEAENTQFFFKAYYKTFLYNDRILFRIPFTYDNGYESALFSADPSLSFGVDLNYRLNSALLVSTSILDFARIGGSISEKPCRDSFSRQFHCGTGLAWTDSKDSHITNTAPTQFKLQMSLLF